MRSPNPKISLFASQFAANYDGQPWYGDSFYDILEKVKPAMAYWQPKRNAHSIAQLVSHIIYWRSALIKRLEGDLEYRPSMKSEFNWRSNEQLKKTGWKSLRKSLDESQFKLLSVLSNQKDSLLKKKYTEKASFFDLINGILQHDLYHLGQIAYLKSIYSHKK